MAIFLIVFTFFSMQLIPVFLMAVSFAAAPATWAQNGSGHAPVAIRGRNALDTAQVHKMYLEGDFDRAIAVLEKALKEGNAPSHADSVFAFKHLGVMYTAKYESRETGKRYMYQLLYIEPTVRIMDMYASDMIYMIFKNIQEEVELNRVKDPKKTAVKTGSPEGHPGQASPRRTWPYWTAGAVAAIGVGAITYFVLTAEPKAGHDNGIGN